MVSLEKEEKMAKKMKNLVIFIKSTAEKKTLHH